MLAETQLVKDTGLARETFRVLRSRHLIEGHDFQRKKKNAIHYTPEGIRKLKNALASMGVTEFVDRLENGTESALEAKDSVIWVKIVRWPINPTLVMVQFADGQTDYAHIGQKRHREKMPPGFTIPIRQNGSRWELACRAPRFRAKW